MIRKTLETDIPAVMAIYDAARAFMRHQQHKHNKCTANPRFAAGQGSAFCSICIKNGGIFRGIKSFFV